MLLYYTIITSFIFCLTALAYVLKLVFDLKVIFRLYDKDGFGLFLFEGAWNSFYSSPTGEENDPDLLEEEKVT